MRFYNFSNVCWVKANRQINLKVRYKTSQSLHNSNMKTAKGWRSVGIDSMMVEQQKLKTSGCQTHN